MIMANGCVKGVLGISFSETLVISPRDNIQGIDHTFNISIIQDRKFHKCIFLLLFITQLSNQDLSDLATTRYVECMSDLEN